MLRSLRVVAFLAAELLSLAGARPATAQADTVLAVLTLPEGFPIFCRVPDSQAARQLPRAVVAREFHFGADIPIRLIGARSTNTAREIQVGFDSTGRPILLSDAVSHPGSGGTQVVVQFTPAGDAVGRRVEVTVDSAGMAAALARGDTAAGRAAVRAPVMRELSQVEQAQARALSNWLWQRRCGRS